MDLLLVSTMYGVLFEDITVMYGIGVWVNNLIYFSLSKDFI